MKRASLFIFLMLICRLSYCQLLPSGIVTVTPTSNSIIVDFTLPDFEICDTSVVDPYGVTEVFNYILIDYFGSIDDIGYPEIPQLSIDISVPYGAINFQSSCNIIDDEVIPLTRRYLPAQEAYEEDTMFNLNSSYYASSGSLYNFDSQISEPYLVFGEQGITLYIFPFKYNPLLGTLEVTYQSTYTLSFSIDSSKGTGSTYESSVKDEYLSYFFENYSSAKSGTDFNGRYLIISDPSYESALEYFVNYKENLGYDVNMVTTATTGYTSTDIKTYLESRYNNSDTRPDYVLLVGDHGDIPASDGNPTGIDKNDPITDLNYARLDGDDYFADVFLGRFPISNTTELQNIINKTIYMEMNLHSLDKKAKFLAGSESSNWMERQFEKGHNYVIEKTFDPEGYTSSKLYQSTDSEVLDALNDNPIYFVYSGHGWNTYIAGGTFTINSTTLNTAENSVYPFVFSFACLTGNFAYSSASIGEQWVGNSAGGVAYYGSSVSTYVSSDKAIEKKIFGDTFDDNEHISGIINLGMKAYWKRFWSFWNRSRTKRYMKAYNLLGDPSLNIQGTGGCYPEYIFDQDETFNSGDTVIYHARDLIVNNSSFIVNSGASVTLLSGGLVNLKPGFFASKGSNVNIRIEECGVEPVFKSLRINPVMNAAPGMSKVEDINAPEIMNTYFTLYPNPASSTITISYILDHISIVSFDIYNQSGTKIASLLNTRVQNIGEYENTFSINGFDNGIYIYRFRMNDEISTGLLVKM